MMLCGAGAARARGVEGDVFAGALSRGSVSGGGRYLYRERKDTRDQRFRIGIGTTTLG